MLDRDLKNLLAESLKREEGLIQILEGALELIFTDKQDLIEAKNMLQEDLEDGFEWNGCFQPLSIYKTNIENQNLKDITNQKLSEITKS